MTRKEFDKRWDQAGRKWAQGTLGLNDCVWSAFYGDLTQRPESAEALALLRELNDALVIPGWLQPRVDAVLDGHEHKVEGKWCVFTQQFDCRTLGDCNDNGCHRNRNFSQPQEGK